MVEYSHLLELRLQPEEVAVQAKTMDDFLMIAKAPAAWHAVQ